MKRAITLVALVALAVSCTGRGSGKTSKTAQVESAQAVAQAASVKPVKYKYNVKAVYPHDTGAYTQGLFWHNGHLYEGTGQNGHSELRRVELKSGRVLQRTKLDKKDFGEGAAYLDGMIYQLTWVSGRAFIYDATDFRRVGSFSYDGEGWGLTSDGKELYMSDGSERIAVRDPKSFGVVRTFDVTVEGRPVDSLNELEWIDGLIWANRYYYNEIVMIDPSSGAVVGIIDLEGIQAPSDKLPDTDVLNGIAYDPASGRIFVTGKNWNKLYQIEIAEQ